MEDEEGRLVNWLWWGETDVSELQPLRALFSSPGYLQCGLWMMILNGANSQLVYESAVAAPSTVWRSCQQKHLCCTPSTGWFPASRGISGSHQNCLVSCQPRHLWSEWEVGEENSLCPCGTSGDILCAVKSYGMGPTALLPI
jgi:hypothetical protein